MFRNATHHPVVPLLNPRHSTLDPVSDFVIDETDRAVNVKNAPSPTAATASLKIGRFVVERLASRFT